MLTLSIVKFFLYDFHARKFEDIDKFLNFPYQTVYFSISLMLYIAETENKNFRLCFAVLLERKD